MILAPSSARTLTSLLQAEAYLQRLEAVRARAVAPTSLLTACILGHALGQRGALASLRDPRRQKF